MAKLKIMIAPTGESVSLVILVAITSLKTKSITGVSDVTRGLKLFILSLEISCP